MSEDGEDFLIRANTTVGRALQNHCTHVPSGMLDALWYEVVPVLYSVFLTVLLVVCRASPTFTRLSLAAD